MKRKRGRPRVIEGDTRIQISCRISLSDAEFVRRRIRQLGVRGGSAGFMRHLIAQERIRCEESPSRSPEVTEEVRLLRLVGNAARVLWSEDPDDEVIAEGVEALRRIMRN